MSVQTWRRSNSKMKYLNEAYNLLKEVQSFLYSITTKYRVGMGDKIQSILLEGIYNGKVGNSIFALGSKDELHQRRYHLQLMVSAVDTACMSVTTLIDVYRKIDGVSDKKMSSLLSKEKTICKMGTTINNCIFGLIKSDMDRWNSKYPDDKVSVNARLRSAMGDIRFLKNNTENYTAKKDIHVDENFREIIPKEELPEYDFSAAFRPENLGPI